MKGRYEDEYRWAKENQDEPLGQRFLELAGLYTFMPENGTLAFLQCTAEYIRRYRAACAAHAIDGMHDEAQP